MSDNSKSKGNNDNSNNEYLVTDMKHKGTAKQVPKTKSSAPIDITNAANTSKDIIDITNTPDVASWNKETVQIKNNIAYIMIRKTKETTKEKGPPQEIATPTTTAIGLKEKGNENLIIDPANKKDVYKVVNSVKTLTDKA
jgi:hypothetical protein